MNVLCFPNDPYLAQQQLLSQQLPAIQSLLAQLGQSQALSQAQQVALMHQLQVGQTAAAAVQLPPSFSVPPPNMAVPPPNLSVPPPNVTVPPPPIMAGQVGAWPDMSMPPPNVQPESDHLLKDGQLIQERMELFAPVLEQISSIKDMVEFRTSNLTLKLLNICL